MNVLHISTPMSWRGGEQQLAYLIEELSKKNISQLVVCSAGSEMEKYCQNNKINFTSQPKPISISLFSAKRISAICKKFGIDLIHAHDSHAHSVSVLSASLFGNKTPVVLSRKVDFPINRNWFSRYKYNHRSIKKIICVSEAVKNVLSPDIKNKNVLASVYDGIDLKKFKYTASGILRYGFSILPDELIIGNVAAIAPHKDYFTFVNTAEILLKKNLNAKFLIIGDGPEKTAIESYIRSKNLQGKIIMTGFRNDIPKILPELDMFLFTSKTEGLGSSILDAYLCNVPVVAASAGGIPEIVQNGKTGLLSPPQKALLLAENVLKLIADPELKKSLTENAKEFVTNFSKERTAEATLSVYKEILAR